MGKAPKKKNKIKHENIPRNKIYSDEHNTRHHNHP